MGSASLFFAIQPERALLSDINQDLVNTVKMIRDHPIAVSNRMSKIPLGRRSFYRLRGTDPDGLDKIDQAARFLFLNRFAFNGVHRTDLRGRFNVPFAASGTGNLLTKEEILKFSSALRCAVIVCQDFQEFVQNEVKSGDFVYLDPPYAVSSRRVFREYNPSIFGINDLRRLADVLRTIDERGAKFVVSYAYSKETLAFFKGWGIRRVLVRRHVSGLAKHRRRAAEIICTNC